MRFRQPTPKWSLTRHSAAGSRFAVVASAERSHHVVSRAAATPGKTKAQERQDWLGEWIQPAVPPLDGRCRRGAGSLSGIL
jgi:hypothetical protein